MKRVCYIYYKVCARVVMTLAFLLVCASMSAQSYAFRYVDAENGNYDNSGLSWAEAKNSLQNAIDELKDILATNPGMKGYVYVAGSEEGMTYVPTGQTLPGLEGLFNTSFRIYERIYVYGGFKGDEVAGTGEGEETLPYKRIMSNDQTYAMVESEINADDIEHAVRRWNFKYKTILSGNHSSVVKHSFTYNKTRNTYTTSFPLNSNHVVWFATNGEIEVANMNAYSDVTEENQFRLRGHFMPLEKEAVVDGCTITGGYASSRNTTERDHNGFGGGVYMVKNSVLRNCIVEECAATLRGGGVYMDGGGEVERCYIHTCQAAGVGAVDGYGGAVCVDYDGSVEHSYIIQSAARLGGGLAICHNPGEYPFKDVGNKQQISSYDPFAVSTVVSNCTSTAEAGGIYLDQGGTINHCSVVNNKCTGPDVIYNGRRHGRTGGIYIHNRGTVYNTVGWGNEVPANNDVQFASSKDGNAPADAKIAIYHCAFSNHDITNWSNATKEEVLSLSKDNVPASVDAVGNYPIFRQPTEKAGIIYNETTGAISTTANADGEAYQRVYNWHPRAASSLRMKAVQVNKSIQGISEEVQHAHTDVDVVGRKFDALSCIGALEQTYRVFTVAYMEPLDQVTGEMSDDSDHPGQIPTYFVDPERKIFGENNTEENPEAPITGYLDNALAGESWTHPGSNLPNAIYQFYSRQWTSGDKKDWYNIGGTKNADGTFTGGKNYKHVQIFMKEGSITTAGRGSYLGLQTRTSAIRPRSNMRLYGGFSSKKEDGSYRMGTDISDHNQRISPTRVSADILSSDYMNNAAHVFALINVHDVIIDGFRLYSGNANLNMAETYSTEEIKYGGGLIVNNTSRPVAERIDMTGNILRNCAISNCSAPEGSSIYVNGSNPKADGTPSRAELTVINCVIRNSTAGDMHKDHNWFVNHETDAGVVTANGNAHIWLRNCDIVNNCGYALKATNTANVTQQDNYSIEVYNSIIFSNGLQMMTERSNIHKPVVCDWANTDRIIGNYIYTDYDAGKPRNLASDQKYYNILTRIKSEDMTEAVDGSGNPLTTYTGERIVDANGDPIIRRYPYFVNPSRNVGHSEDVDQPLYGGTVNYEPMNLNPIVNGANPDFEDADKETGVVVNAATAYNDNSKSISYDNGNLSRTYGGAPDAGAIEDTRLPEAGAVIYVTQNGSGKMDGSNWANAIAGNLVYRVGDSYVVDELNGDGANHTVTTKNNLYRGGYAVDYVLRDGTTTYVDKQTITPKHIKMTYNADGSVTTEEETQEPLDEKTSSHSITGGLSRQKTEFIYGEKSGSSRNFYRTNLIESKIPIVTQTTLGYKDINANTDISITNNRDEDYVSGLQFAVEKAAALNKGTTKAEDRVQVWVGNGIYEDYKGFVMRDKVTVYGGFPTNNHLNPGMAERHALISKDVPVSELNSSLKNKEEQYETILQIIDKKPYNSETWGFDNSVILYKDKDYTEKCNKTVTTETTITVPVYYRRDGLSGDYYEVRGSNVVADLTNKLINPSFEQNGGNGQWNDSKAKYGWTNDKGTFSLKAGSNNYSSSHGAGFQNNTGGFELYQDVDGLEAGFYRVSCQGFNKDAADNNIKLFANGEERQLMTFNTSDGNITQVNAAAVNLLAQGKYDENWVDVYVGNAGHLRLGLKGTYTGNGLTLFDNFRLERLSGSEVEGSATSIVTEQNSNGENVPKTNSTEYSTFRKPVLFMPDVCLTTNWPGAFNVNGKRDDGQSNTVRWQQSNGIVSSKSGTGMEVYTDAHWDGFTIRNGFYYDYYANRDGGAGVRMFEGGTLENCVVIDNANMWGARQRGGGGYCDGRTSKVISCFFVNNLNSGIRNANPISSTDVDTNGGGIYLLVGTCYNSLFANNICWGNDSRGAGIYIEQATFYNNTVAYNTCRKRDKTVNTAKGNGVHQYEGSGNGATLNVFNTIFFENTGPAIGAQRENFLTSFKNCYIQSYTAMSGTITGKMINCILDNAGKDKNGQTYHAPNPFELGDAAKDENNYRLASSSLCINKGEIPEDAREGFPEKDVDFAARVQDCQVDIGAYEFDGSKSIEPNLSDPDYAIFYVSQNGGGGLATASSPEDAACAIKLQKVLDAAGRWKYAANYYTDETKNVTNFKQAQLEAELTKAGVTSDQMNTMLAGLKNRTVVVKLAGDYPIENATTHQMEPTGFKYTPTRSTNIDSNIEDNVLDYSFIVPRGVQLWGGYRADEVQKDPNDASQGKWPAFSDETRDVLGNPTRLSGEIYNESTETTGNVFHVVTFTNNLFGTNEKLYEKETEGVMEQQTDQLAEAFTEEKDRAVLDGLFIQEGKAIGTDDANRYGAGAVVTEFAHIRNCIVMDNEASNYGGGLYLKPRALVSGSIIKENTAKQGGGIYVEKPVNDGRDNNVRLYTSTVIRNTASSTGGGVYFSSDKPNLVANSTAFWLNTANDLANVAGNLEGQAVEGSTTEAVYAFNYCGIESTRVPGINNIELPTSDDDGVRWDHSDRYENWSTTGIIQYVPITMSSILARAGMTYDVYEALCSNYPTLDLQDMTGLYRLKYDEDIAKDNGTWEDGNTKEDSKGRVYKDNTFMEIGARVLNKSFEIQVETHHVMTRLFVAKTENLPDPEKLSRLQDNIYHSSNEEVNRLVDMYKQMGSSFANPFHRFGDALDYIKSVRDIKDPTTGKYTYRNTRFEVFLSEGEFRPYRDAYGKQGKARTNTFVIPEGVSIIGGVKVDANTREQHDYCQVGWNETVTRTGSDATITVPTQLAGETTSRNITLNAVITQDIRDQRDHFDYNGNNVLEPWEMETRTRLMGDVVDANSEGATNVYHVISCLADPGQVGQLPKLYKNYASGEFSEEVADVTASQLVGLTDDERSTLLLNHLHQECQESRDRRAIILDGLYISGGYANKIEPAHAIPKDDLTIENDETAEAFEDRKGRQNATQLTYFRGGGILVEGNWDETFRERGEITDVLGVAKRDIPLIISDCEFQNNVAGNGGTIYTNGSLYVVSNHFAQNLSVGPLTTYDQPFIPWVAGGAIATNYECNVWNSIFDNNEARRGNYEITEGSITNADERQGSGGVISASQTSVVHVTNCDMVMNKAVQFPAIYNFLDNGTRNHNDESIAKYGYGYHYVVNSLFWWNEATGSTVSAAVPDEIGSGADLRKPNHVANFGKDLLQEMLYFCAYEKDRGRFASLPVYENSRKAAKRLQVETENTGNHNSLAELKNGTFDFSQFGQYKRDGSGKIVEGTDSIYNHNQTISAINQAADGPYFVQPSLRSGVDGYMQNADWLVSRLNALIDNGWSYLEQMVVQPDLTSTNLETRFYDRDKSGIYDKGLSLEGKIDSPALIDAEASNAQPDGLSGGGFYNAHSKSVYERFYKYGYCDLLPLADQKYMNYMKEGEDEQHNMRRISTHPKVGEQEVFIDIGVYEYQFVQLTSLGNEVDVIWVGPESKGDKNGTTPNDCTSDLQEAIETLLLSRNGHDKMIKIIGGTGAEFSPINMSNGFLTFYIKTPLEDVGVTNPSHIADNALGIKSLTIRGGYSNVKMDDWSDGEELRDVEQYPVKLVMKNTGNYTDDQLAHLFVIEDVKQRETFGNFINRRNTNVVNKTVPIIFDGLTFENSYAKKLSPENDAAAILYQEQYFENNKLLKPDQDEGGKNYHKLIIKDCVFANNGAIGEYDVPAVLIKEGGGQSLIVNSLFHSNSGSPLKAVNTQVVNCTFAMNGGHLILSDRPETYDVGEGPVEYPSELHNSLIWKEDQEHSMATQFEVPATLYNTTTKKTTDKMTRNAISHYMDADNNEIIDESEDNKYNVSLDDDPMDVFLGPNFENPEDVDKTKRNFHTYPSNRVINCASKDKYIELVPYYATYPDYTNNNKYVARKYDWAIDEEAGKYAVQRAYTRSVGDQEVEVKYWFHSVQRADKALLTEDLLKKGSSTNAFYESELSSLARLSGNGIERGAYESEAIIERVIYVSRDGGEGKKDGTSWQTAYSISDLQKAVDVAAIYYQTSAMNEADKEKAYVFVRNGESDKSLMMRDGVSVYGGIRLDFKDMALKDKENVLISGDPEDPTNNPPVYEYTKYSDDAIDTYVRQVKAGRDGNAAEGNLGSIIVGLNGDDRSLKDFKSGFHLDGFKITGVSGGDAAVNLTKSKSAVTGCVITGNTQTGGQSVVKLNKGLLYNSLIYGNSADVTVNVGADGYMLNCTVIANRGTTVSGTTANVKNTIDGSEATPLFAPYQNPSNGYAPSYLTDYQPYYYQLAENSTQINAGDETSTVNSWLPEELRSYVDFGSDRDVLGNPRRLGGNVDNGCFETWKVTDNRYATNVTNQDVAPTLTGVPETDATALATYYGYYTDNYGGHLYPHAGSVVYLMEDANLVFKVDEANGNAPLFTDQNAIQPGYLLVQKGASLYGQGNTIQASYVAVERDYAADQQYNLVSVPFPIRHVSESGVTAKTYSGLARSAWDYHYKAEDSECWESADFDEIAANQGWLLNRGTGASANTLRFTGWGASSGVFAYTEGLDADGNGDKKIELTQYNANDLVTNDYPHFTKDENMGWNLVGLPWLISNYATDTYDGTEKSYQMNVPHLFYKMGGDGEYTEKSSGSVYSEQSWASGATLSVGDGFFTQTAIIGDSEMLSFKLLMYSDPSSLVAPARRRVGIARQSDGTRSDEKVMYEDVVDVYPQAEADAKMDYRLGSDGIKWMAFDERVAQIYVQNAVGTRLSLVSAAPVETNIDLGVKVPEAGNYVISLPEPEAYNAYAEVWLIDQQTGQKVNLKEGSYVLTVSEAGDFSNRLKLRFGGLQEEQMMVEKVASPIIKVAARNGRIPLRGFSSSDQINVYTAGGALMYSGPVSDIGQKHLPDGVYVIRRE